jgi:hypothetical protein
MNTSGHGNDGLIAFIPLGVAVVIGVILFGGPTDALEASDALVREVVYAARDVISALF